MNLLRIQDALKNASDQQLMQMMQAPDSTAPSYLVLSEIRRRKDMRAKQAPEGDSRRTVAEELTAPEDQGIRAMAAQMPEEPPQDVADQAGIEAMREGGVVRMQAGGQPPRRPLSEMSDEELMDLQRAGRPLVDTPQGFSRLGVSPSLARAGAAAQGYSLSDIQAELRRRVPEPAFVPIRPPQPPSTIQPEPGFTSAPVGTFADPGAAFGNEPMPAQQPATTQPQPNADRNRTLDALRDALPARPDADAERRAAARSEGRPAGGGAAAPAATAATETAMPTLADLYRQNQGLFADGIGALRERAQQERVDPAARRNEALNMALIEAGLRIAGSRNPSLAGAIGEGAVPAVQSYGQQLGQIRAEQREARRDELELAKQELNRQFAIGQISAAEFRTRTDNINANIRAASAERAADRRAAASEAAADARHRSTMEVERFRAQNRPIDLSGIPSLISSTGTQIRDIQRELSLIGGEPPREIRGRPNPDHQRWSSLTSQLNDLNTEMAEYRRMIRSGLPTRGATGQTGTTGATTLPSGARIENGRYIPAGS